MGDTSTIVGKPIGDASLIKKKYGTSSWFDLTIHVEFNKSFVMSLNSKECLSFILDLNHLINDSRYFAHDVEMV